MRPVDVDAGYVRNAMRMDWAKEAVRINDPSTGRHLSEARSILVKELIRSGKVAGAICAKTVTLQSTSQVEGDIHHMAFAIEQGAVFEGRSRRAGNEADLNAVIEAKGGHSNSA